MRIFFIAPYSGKNNYQKVYDEIITIIESTGNTIISAEKITFMKEFLLKKTTKNIKAKKLSITNL